MPSNEKSNCEHRNTLDPAPADPGYVYWCADCGALLVKGHEWKLPGRLTDGANAGVDAVEACAKHRKYYRGAACRYRVEGMEAQARGMDHLVGVMERLEATLSGEKPALGEKK